MNKYIDADRLKAEIEKQMDENCKLGEKAECFNHRALEDNDILAIIDSLQQEQPDVNLEKELENFARQYPMEDSGSYRNLMTLARHFYELGKARKEE